MYLIGPKILHTIYIPSDNNYTFVKVFVTGRKNKSYNVLLIPDQQTIVNINQTSLDLFYSSFNRNFSRITPLTRTTSTSTSSFNNMNKNNNSNIFTIQSYLFSTNISTTTITSSIRSAGF